MGAIPIRPDVSCPSPEDLQALVGGSLPAGGESRLVEHLSGCAACQRALDALVASRLQEVGRLLQEGCAAPRPPEGFRQAMLALKDAPGSDGADGDGWDEAVLLGLLSPGETPGHLGRLGPYSLVEVVGRGGFGMVFRAVDPALKRPVALKVLAPHLVRNTAARKRFAREARAAAGVRHEHTVAIHGVDEANGLPFLVMEYVAGVSLQQRLDRAGPLPYEQVVRIGRQIAAGLAAAHAWGLIHRDIKPANILLEDGRERVKITDFGLARAADDASTTHSGVLVGTPQYMAPEQARGEPLDHRADLFSLGSVLYAMCTGQAPFQAPTTLAVLRRFCEEPARPVRELNPAIPPALADLVAVLHAKDPADRFASSAEVAELLGRHLAHVERPREVPPPPRLGRRDTLARTWGRRRGVGLWVLLAAAGVAVAVAYQTGAVTLFRARGPEAARAGLDGPRLTASARPEDLRISRAAGPFPGAAFSPDGQFLALAAGREVQLWHRPTGTLRHTLTGHRLRVWTVAFSGDGRRLVSGAAEWDQPRTPGEVRLWDVEGGACRPR